MASMTTARCLGSSLLLAGLLVASLAPRFAAGGEPDPHATARDHYRKAMAAADKGDHAAAAADYGRAYELTRDPLLLYKVAHSHEQAGARDEARDGYRRYLDKRKDAPDRADVEAKIAALAPVAAAAPATTAAVGAQSPPVAAATPAGADAAVVPAPADTATPLGADNNELPPSLPPSFIDDAPRWQRTAAWVSVGAAAVLLTTGAMFAESANGRERDLARLTEYRDPDTGLPLEYSSVHDDYVDASDEGAFFQTGSRLAFVGAGAAAASAALFFMLDARRDAPEPHALSRTPTVTPLVAPGVAFVTLAWEY